MPNNGFGGPKDQSGKDGLPSPEEQIEVLKRKVVKLSDIYPWYPISVEVVDTGLFKGGKFEGKPIPDIEYFLIQISILLLFPKLFKEKIVSSDFDNVLIKLSEPMEYCKVIGVGENLDNVMNRVRKLRDRVLKIVSIQRFMTVESLILLFFKSRFTTGLAFSDRAVARCIERLLKIPSINEHMITDEGIRQKIRRLRKEGKIPERG